MASVGSIEPIESRMYFFHTMVLERLVGDNVLLFVHRERAFTAESLRYRDSAPVRSRFCFIIRIKHEPMYIKRAGTFRRLRMADGKSQMAQPEILEVSSMNFISHRDKIGKAVQSKNVKKTHESDKYTEFEIGM